jgi:type IV pilus assembly protein PilB
MDSAASYEKETGTARAKASVTAFNSSQPSKRIVSQTVRFGDWLLERKLANDEQITAALTDQRQHGGRLGEALSRLKYLEEGQVIAALAQYLRIERWSLDNLSSIDMTVAQSLPERIAKRFQVVALGTSNGAVQVAMADPLNVVAKDTVAQIFERQVKAAIAAPREIRDAIDAVYHGSQAQEQRLRDLVDGMVQAAEPETKAAEAEPVEAAEVSEVAANKAPVVQFVDLMLNQAVKSRASDVHIEPQEQSMTIRMRVDGMLREMVPPPAQMRNAVIARVKILSGMDIAERRLPQDGRLKIKAPRRDIDVRVSVLPTIYGEKVVMRLLDKEAVSHDLDKLGFEPRLLRDFKNAISKPHGIIIVTGPTGSGKSTTLYAALNYLRNPHENITTVEDPVEYRLGGINQIQVRPDIGLTFANCLRSILRQDPDIILIGEVRDRETMEIAVQAALTGHLVLTTLHTNDAPSTLSRLAYMGLDRYLLASTLNLVTAQRLLRRLCDRCKKRVELPEPVIRRLGIPARELAKATFYEANGCNACGGTGYKGRLPIFEFLLVDDEIKEKITQNATEAQVRALARARGYGGLVDSAALRLCRGLTTLDEAVRAAFVKDEEEDSATEGHGPEKPVSEGPCQSTV